MLHVSHDKHVHEINYNYRIISCYSLDILLESLLFDGVYKTKLIQTYIIIIVVFRGKNGVWRQSNDVINFRNFLVT